MKNIIFVAPPAAGKGTQSDLLVNNFGYIHISTGDMLREEIASGSELGIKVKNIIDNGGLVSDEVMIDLIKNKFKMIDGKPFILDGFPRTLNQAEALKKIFDDENISYQTILLDLDKEVAKARIVGRVVCKCGKSFNLYIDAMKPKVEGICDGCGEKLEKRNDDNEQSFEIRFNAYTENTTPIIDFYKNENTLAVVDASKDVNDIFEDIKKVITHD